VSFPHGGSIRLSRFQRLSKPLVVLIGVIAAGNAGAEPPGDQAAAVGRHTARQQRTADAPVHATAGAP
jgi:hypothetical protein